MNNEFNEKTGELFLGGANPKAVNESNMQTRSDEITENELEAIFAGNLNRNVAVEENLKHSELFREEQVSNEEQRMGR